MKAVFCNKYGPPSLLQIKDVKKPAPKDSQVLVKVHCSAINDYDWSMCRGNPFIYRLLFGFRKPKNPIPGMELSGTIEAVGSKVTKFKKGDAVYGDISDHGFGSFAEYIAIHEDALVLKPNKMSFEEAAALSHASMLAAQGLIDVGEIKEGQKVLINGAGGGVGTFALQIAKQFKAEVTGIDAGEKLEEMRSIGYDHVIDYKKEDFTKSGEKYDLILDPKTNRPPRAYEKALAKGGKYVTVGGHLNRLLQVLIARKFKNKNMHVVALKANKDLGYIHELYEAGLIKPLIDGPHPLEDTPKLIQYFGEGLHKGKVIIKIIQD